jgi:hypothetical protein
MIKLVLSAAFGCLVLASAVSAQPNLGSSVGLSSALKAPATTDIIQVQERRDMRRDDDRRRYTPGRRYRSAPQGWQRHGIRRPGDWRGRGCIQVGPIWFCP